MRTTGGANVSNEVASVHHGRFAQQADFSNCTNWTALTSGINSTDGTIIGANGTTTVLCSTVHPLACCQ